MDGIKLTQYSHGAGCGCKISPKVLSEILQEGSSMLHDDRLLVGYENKDDAAVYDMGNGVAIISTTDFFMPIVDDPFTFGQIAAANAISDVYAMGGTPLMAISILGWPVNKLSADIARQVVDGGRNMCAAAGILLAGGHSIDSPEPVFGLAVTGQVEIKKIKRNNTAGKNNKIYLTKPLGVGILTTALKQGKLRNEHWNIATDTMLTLNKIGTILAQIPGVTAMTDVTGFGLLGHLTEMCEGSGVSAIIDFDKVPRFDVVDEYINAGCIPGGTNRNWDSYGSRISLSTEKDQRSILCDPQTSGGLLIAVQDKAEAEVEKILIANNINPVPFGRLVSEADVLITVE